MTLRLRPTNKQTQTNKQTNKQTDTRTMCFISIDRYRTHENPSTHSVSLVTKGFPDFFDTVGLVFTNFFSTFKEPC